MPVQTRPKPPRFPSDPSDTSSMKHLSVSPVTNTCTYIGESATVYQFNFLTLKGHEQKKCYQDFTESSNCLTNATSKIFYRILQAQKIFYLSNIEMETEKDMTVKICIKWESQKQ